MANWLTRVARALTLKDSGPIQNEGMPRQVVVLVEPVGSSGTSIFSGYFSEEYLADLQGSGAAEIYDKMRRQDSRIKMVLSAVMNPIRRANWEITPGDGENPDRELHADFVRHVLFKDMDKSWTQLVSEILTMIPFGHSVFEVTHKVVFDHPKFGSYTGLRSLGFRSQKTIEKWNLDKNGCLKSITQMAYGDLDRTIDIPGEFLVVFTLEKEGDNYEGISGLRACYGPWFRKSLYLKLMAIGIEKTAVPTPKGAYPPGFQNTDQYGKLVEILKAYTSHQQNFLLYPEGINLDFSPTEFDSKGVKDAIDFENSEMTVAFLANFLLLGQSGSGSYALSFDLSDFFLGGIEYLADLISEKFNQEVIPNLIKMKYGPQECYPQAKASGISDKAGKEFGELLKALSDGRWLTPDDPSEAHLRKRLGLPEASEKGRRPLPAAAPPVPGATFSEEVKLSDRRKPRELMKEAKNELQELMRRHLQSIGGDLVGSVMRRYKGLPKTSQVDAIKGVVASGRQAYQDELQNHLSDVAVRALEQARREVPSKKKVQLSQGLQLSAFDRLPKRTQKKLAAQSKLIVDTQIASLEKAVFFQFTSSVDSVADSAPLLEHDLAEAAQNFAEAGVVATAAGNASSFVVNESRNAFFFDEEVLEDVESFTFVNGDPESPICKDLAGSVFRADDPQAERYYPPLHHNCKSFLVPNLKYTAEAKRAITGLKPSSPSVEKSISLAELSAADYNKE